MTVITDTDVLARFCQRQQDASFIAVDTEFMRERTYWPILCLVQVAGPQEATAIDALAPGIDLAPLLALMADPGILKVFHAARQDIEIFFNLSGAVPAPLFDTQIAAMVCGFGDAASYETLVAKLARASLDKSSRFTDWSHRPLTERQIRYALADVVHLRTVYEKLQQQLASNGRASWFAEEMAELSNPETYRSDPGEAWRRFRLRGRIDARFFGVLQELAAWRETEYFTEAERAVLALTEAGTRLADSADPVPDDGYFKVAALRVVRVAWQAERRLNGDLSAGQNCHAVPALLPVPDGVVSRFLQRGIRELLLGSL